MSRRLSSTATSYEAQLVVTKEDVVDGANTWTMKKFYRTFVVDEPRYNDDPGLSDRPVSPPLRRSAAWHRALMVR